MLIALLAVLGVDLIVIVVLVAAIVARRRWVKHQSGAFAGAIRVSGGEVDGLGPKWKRGEGRWVSDVLVWSKAPLMLGMHLVPVARRSAEDPQGAAVKRLGDNPIVVAFDAAGATIEVAARREQGKLLVGPFAP